VHESVGYVPFSKRPETPLSPPEPRKPLPVTHPTQVDSDTINADVVIIGTGAGASLLAHSILRENPNREILMLERGDYIDRSEMNEDEIDMLSKLYAEGALQLTRDFKFQVLQGKCVGGTTVVNNAVCFDLPDDVLGRWNDSQGLDAGLDVDRMREAHTNARALTHIQRQDYLNTVPDLDPTKRNLSPGGLPFMKGIAKLKMDQFPNDAKVIEANIQGCYGCGYCNIGCRYGKKMAMTESVLPEIVAKWPGQLKIIAGCEVEKLTGSGPHIETIQCRLKDGRRLDVHANTVAVCAGAVSSSLILLRSSIGRDRVGKNLSFNLGSPITGVFDQVINAYDGLQISHYIQLQPNRGFILETWFNPPVSQALTMPGWFDDHYNNMLRYNRMASAGILVATESNAVVRDAGIFRRDIDYTPTKSDLEKLADGMIVAGEIFFAGGASSIMPHSHDFMEFQTPSELQYLKQLIPQKGSVTLGTGHPQGGNAISNKRDRGVIDPEFRVFGYDNLFVCDASVFPCSIGVNPQLTVMALADYAGRFVAHSGSSSATLRKAHNGIPSHARGTGIGAPPLSIGGTGPGSPAAGGTVDDVKTQPGVRA
ncbi:MAG: GMC family oxidoreductase N-terminal domain-containing protein, partial [bacterium]|nr:GMC family oxidoreductase N-terminal domain-containing protein [Candidatus Kapabacteria bacterium]